ncbi:cobalamin-dependent protein, partial [Candidatus Dependentiae bacterium]|nr:cobalamin-dependent protein [Candidatus Dependentiae bacterium]
MSNNDFPVGFAYISSVLRNAGHKIYGLNLNNIYGYNSSFEMINDQIIKSIEENQPELIGIGGLCIDYKFIKDAIFIIRKINPDIPVVLGGGIVNNDAEFILDSLRPDFGIIGEAEEAIVKLADKIENNDLNFSDISNIGFFQNGKLELTNKNYDYIDINALPYPDYEPFNISEMIENYSLNAFYLHRYPRKTPRIMTIVTARSCPFSCTFCVHMHGSKYRARSIENIMSEIKYMYDKYQFNILVMMDELFAVNKNRLNLFCTELIAQKEKFGWDFNWYFQTHSSAALTEKELNLAKQSGCY